MMLRPLSMLLVAGLLLAGMAPPAAAATLQDFFGSYVGTAEVETLPEGKVAQRDMDIVISPYKGRGFRIHWINVTLVDGRRDVPGVTRRISDVIFVPADDRDHFVEAAEYNPFRQQDEMSPLAGDPVRWAMIDDDTLYVYSFVVLDEGGFELQVYERTLTEHGIALRFERIVDGEVVRRISGRAVRAD